MSSIFKDSTGKRCPQDGSLTFRPNLETTLSVSMPRLNGLAGTFDVDIISEGQALRCVKESSGQWWCIAKPGKSYSFRIVPVTGIQAIFARVAIDGGENHPLSTPSIGCHDYTTIISKFNYQPDGRARIEKSPLLFAKPEHDVPTSTLAREDVVKVGLVTLTLYQRGEILQNQTSTPSKSASSLTVPEGKKWYETSLQTVTGKPQDAGLTTVRATGPLIGSLSFKLATEDAIGICGWDGESHTFTRKVIKPKPQSHTSIAPVDDDNDDDIADIEVVKPPTPTTLEVLLDGSSRVIHEGHPAKQAKHCDNDIVFLDD
eukprot:m.114982 g.114982  ORF g.114982 m.114982 type:complete len:316 (+) comp15481_c0_seq35:76-1023(+)